MSAQLFYCQYCNRSGFKSARSLTQHQSQNMACREIARSSIAHGKRKATSGLLSTSSIIRAKTNNKRQHIEGISTIKTQSLLSSGRIPIDRLDLTEYNNCQEFDDDEYGNIDIFAPDDESYANDSNEDGIVTMPAIDEIRATFKQYCQKAMTNFLPNFTHDQAVAINLLCVLRKSKASLDTYEGVMKWHFMAAGTLDLCQNLSDTTRYLDMVN